MRRLLLLTLLLALVPAAAAPAAQVEPRIVGGTSADPGNFPWQVAVLMPGGGQYCGGSLVGPRHVLTADHCDVWVGDEIRVHSSDRTSGGQLHEVQAVRRHPLADGGGSPARYDIAMLELTEPVVGAQPIAVVGTGDEAFWADGAPLTITGWGDTVDGGNTGSDLLQEAIVPRVSDASCALAYPGDFDPSDMVCAGYPAGGTDTCQGDSGGPIAAPAVDAPRKDVSADWRLVGVTSWGVGCALPGLPGVYARLAVPGIRAWTSVSPVTVSDHALTGTLAAGEVLTCEGTTSGEGLFGYRFIRRTGTGSSPVVVQNGPSSAYTVTEDDQGQILSCMAVGENGAGTVTAESTARLVPFPDVTPTPVPEPTVQQPAPVEPIVPPATPAPAPLPAPVVTAPPTTKPVAARVTRVSRRCTRKRRCTFTVKVSGGALAVHAKLKTTVRRRCVRKGRRKTCTKTTTRRLRARRLTGGRFTIATPTLRRGRHVLSVVPVDGRTRRVTFAM